MKTAPNNALMLEQVRNDLPDGFDVLLHSSLNTGVRNMMLLSQLWEAGTERFDGKGEALYAARIGNRLVGIAGTTREQNLPEAAMRMRRLYVLPEQRRKGVARALAQKCMDTGLEVASILTCNARASEAAGPFWLSLGFSEVDLPNITHVYSSPDPEQTLTLNHR